jgi:cytidine deaminase
MIDWYRLRVAARDAAGRAYGPYSGLRVGAVGEAADGRLIVGCNVESRAGRPCVTRGRSAM